MMGRAIIANRMCSLTAIGVGLSLYSLRETAVQQRDSGREKPETAATRCEAREPAARTRAAVLGGSTMVMALPKILRSQTVLSVLIDTIKTHYQDTIRTRFQGTHQDTLSRNTIRTLSGHTMTTLLY